MDDLNNSFTSANRELSAFLRKVSGLMEGTELITESDLQLISRRLTELGPVLEKIKHGVSYSVGGQEEVGRYVNNLRALQKSLEKVHCFMLARKAQLDSDRQHLCGVQGWLSAYHRTA